MQISTQRVRFPLSLLLIVSIVVYSVYIFGIQVTSLAALPSPDSPTYAAVGTDFPMLESRASSRTNSLTSTVYLPLTQRTLATSTSTKLYWGALLDGVVPSTEHMQPGAPLDVFEKRVDKRMSIIHWGQSWQLGTTYQKFDTQWYQNVRLHGSIPLIDWASRHYPGGVDQPDYRLSAIARGDHDSYIRQWAQSAKAWGFPFFLRLDWEMNGDWQFPWSVQLNGNQPADYIKMWQHIHDIFKQVGATNVTWVWCPNISSKTTVPMASLYPGDAYVDWTCLDGYNKESQWMSFNSLLTGSGVSWLYNSYEEILKVAPTKPIMIAETASLEAGDGGAKKAAWITEALLTQLPTQFPMVKAINWFNSDDGNPSLTFPIESSQASVDAFRAGIGSSNYAINRFGNIYTSPIPPPQ